ncbi:unnamed protein product [Prorocentrum cordatum]|uniref:NAD-dependent epimerase/dehydratase domain-containing protein n=1 Tax=Prorocentrum cordatum TaxID=2364126 RepID=A0ABN9RFB0_9DINO|nr:unnamed protein product [Polarella glacialis]CAK0833513.1 unnamed protein product [Polarella glacialis]
MRVFVFGGTQFMGRLTVKALLDVGHQVVLFNRGRTANPFEGLQGLVVVRCDRMGDREGFRDAVRSQGSCDAVVDFIGFQEVYMRDALDALTLPTPPGKDSALGKRFATKHYVFVSSDCVYWAQRVPCVEAEVRLAEQDAEDFPPDEFERHRAYAESTALGEYQLRYGGNKLSCERVLEDAWREDGLPYTVLRLPDAYGPYDNLGGFWDIAKAVEMERPIPSGLGPGRIRRLDGEASVVGRPHRFSWVFAPDARDAILATLAKGSMVHGATLHIAHEEAASLRETAELIAEAMGKPPAAVRFDDQREASVPSTDFGSLDVARALRLLRPWRPTPMRTAVSRAVQWFSSGLENRRYHQHVHREAQAYDEASSRLVSCQAKELPSCWAGSPEVAARVRDGPVVLVDAVPEFTNLAVLGFMQRLMDQAGDVKVCCELRRSSEAVPEQQTWPLRHLAGQLLAQSEHSASYWLESSEVLAQTDLLAELRGPLHGLRADGPGRPAERRLCLGGVGARSPLRRAAPGGAGGLWDCALLGRRKWRLFPPETPPALLCCVGGEPAVSSPVDTFARGPDDVAVTAGRAPAGFGPRVCWECEQTIHGPCGRGARRLVVPDVRRRPHPVGPRRLRGGAGRHRGARACGPAAAGRGVRAGGLSPLRAAAAAARAPRPRLWLWGPAARPPAVGVAAAPEAAGGGGKCHFALDAYCRASRWRRLKSGARAGPDSQSYRLARLGSS